MLTIAYAFVAGSCHRAMSEDEEPLNVPGGKWIAKILIILMAWAWPLVLVIVLIERFLRWMKS